jgi:hypothetical protein
MGDSNMSITTKIALCLAVVVGSGSAALAQRDGNGNRVPGSAVRQYMPASYFDAYASVGRTTVRRSRIASRQRDGDGNPIPGVR